MCDASKKVLIFSHEYPPRIGGTGVVAVQMRDWFLKKGFEVYVLKSDSLIHEKLWFIAYSQYIFSLAKHAELIILNDPVAIYNAGLYFSSSQLSKSICIIHGVESKLDNKGIHSLLLFSTFYRRALRLCSKVVFVSNFLKDHFKEKYYIDGQHFRTSHNGISEVFFQPCKSHLMKDSPYTFITAARFVREKGFDNIFTILSGVYGLGCNFKWIIIGEGSYKKEFQRKIMLSPICELVSFKGKCRQSEIVEAFDVADCYILLSDYQESFGLSYVEAASRGLTCIGYAESGVKEAFTYIANGYLLSRNDIDDSIHIISSLIHGGRKQKDVRVTRDFNSFMEGVGVSFL